jgi:hypothetical protein
VHPGSAHLVKNDGQEDPISRSGCLKPASPAVLNWFKSLSDTEKVQVTRMFWARLPLIANELLRSLRSVPVVPMTSLPQHPHAPNRGTGGRPS